MQTYIRTCIHIERKINSDFYLHVLNLLGFGQSDKASMLDEAIEYLKSLQMQVQVRFHPIPLKPNL